MGKRILQRVCMPFLAAVLVFLAAGAARATVHHEVFLPSTDHELHVYRVFGKEPGKTIMIIGGIQGDEPGGYLTADLYADIDLAKGNLIVVPRANFYSILLNRRNGVTGDMNRKFGPDGTRHRHLEEEVVAILKSLIAESDCLLNLHEGSGYYSPVWISEMENPRRYGQSIIFDSPVYHVPDSDKIINLKELAERVIARVNPKVKEERYKFRLNNHDTLSPETIHSEQRRSATYYALTRGHIPAFGLETSKSIKSLETKIELQKTLINAFMEEMGIVLSSPGVRIEQPKLDYLLIQINNKLPVAMLHGSELTVSAGDEIVVSDIIANYQRGLVADVEGWGSRNDTNIPFRVTKPLRIMVHKDSQTCGWVDIKIAAEASTAAVQIEAVQPAVPGALRVEEFLVTVGDELVKVAAGQTLTVPKGARLMLKGVRTNQAELDDQIFVNFKGYAPPKEFNDGNDLNFAIYTDQDLWRKYSEDEKGVRYPVEAIFDQKRIGLIWVELDPMDRIGSVVEPSAGEDG